MACCAPRLLQRRETRVRPTRPAGPPDAGAPCALEAEGEVQLHPLDVANMRLCMAGAWRFDGLLDLPALEAALASTVAAYPLVAGWLEGCPGGGLALRWGPDNAGSGVVWVTASASGSPPGVHEGWALKEAGLLPPLRRNALLALQATHFPGAAATLVTAAMDHVAADVQGYMDFLAAWCNGCAACVAAGGPAGAAEEQPGGGGAVVAEIAPRAAGQAASKPGGKGLPAAAPMPPAPVFDRAALAAVGGSEGAGTSGSSSSSGLWRDAPFEVHPLSRVSTALMLLRSGMALAGCRTRIWVLPKAVINSLKQALGGAMPAGGMASANDLLGALLVASMAALEPERVAARGGLTLHVVVNARGGGRFGVNVPRGYFGNPAMWMPVWVPAELLLPGERDEAAAPGAAAQAPPSWLPSPQLLAHVHIAVRQALADPDSVVRRRLAWLGRAQAAGWGSSVRLHDVAPLLDGDVCLDNVVNNPFYDLRLGGQQVAAEASLRVMPFPRLAFITPAGPAADRTAGGASGDLQIDLSLPARQWAALAPLWEGAGLACRMDVLTDKQSAAHPAWIRQVLTQLSKTTCAGL